MGTEEWPFHQRQASTLMDRVGGDDRLQSISLSQVSSVLQPTPKPRGRITAVGISPARVCARLLFPRDSAGSVAGRPSPGTALDAASTFLCAPITRHLALSSGCAGAGRPLWGAPGGEVYPTLPSGGKGVKKMAYPARAVVGVRRCRKVIEVFSPCSARIQPATLSSYTFRPDHPREHSLAGPTT
jgi:hypothetical protein